MKIPIVFSSDNNYVPFMAVAIQSIIENANCNHEYNLYVLHHEISTDYQALLQETIKGHAHFSIQFINVFDEFKQYSLHYTSVSIEAYYRLIIPYLFNDYEKVLYLDGDIICMHDIYVLYSQNISNAMIGAIRGIAEIGNYYNSTNHYWDSLLKLKNPDNYFNSGVLLFNNKAFRDEISFENLMAVAQSEKWPSYDQEVLNVVCEDKVSFIPNEWNFIKFNTAQYAPEYLKELYSKAEDKPSIVHFGAGYKPWNNGVYVPFAYEFWKYAMRTPFANEIVYNMNQKFTIYEKRNTDVYTLPLSNVLSIILYRIKKKILSLLRRNE